MIRTRFAPSPTGHLHIGGLRTALYSYLFVRKNQGHFILRIEDTDQKREVEGATEHLVEMLKTFGLEYDEGPKREGKHSPYIQSQRVELHRKAAQELIEKKAAYRCFCTEERLNEMREQQMAAKKAPMYERKCLNLPDEEIEKKLSAGEPYVIRLKIPYDQPIKFTDLVRGKVTFDPKTLDDSVLLKSDGFPTYHLANIVDDHAMEISHVIRGEEWLPSTPKHLVLYQAFGWNPPEFAHLPLILNKDKSKLSKRQNDVNVEDYLAKGYLKEAILNFISLLGWHPGGGEEEEIFSLEELTDKFSLEKVHKGGAVFDLEKLDWFNWQWRRRSYLTNVKIFAKNLDPQVVIQEVKKGHPIHIFKDPKQNEELLVKKSQLLFTICEKWLDKKYLDNRVLLSKRLLTVEDKILKNPEEINEQLDFYFNLPDFRAELLLNDKMKVNKEMAEKALIGSSEVLEEMEEPADFNNQAVIQEHLLQFVKTLECKNGQVFWPLRAALSGKEFSPGVFEIIWALGKHETLDRLEKAIAKLR